jgi:hypothetical protein
VADGRADRDMTGTSGFTKVYSGTDRIVNTPFPDISDVSLLEVTAKRENSGISAL